MSFEDLGLKRSYDSYTSNLVEEFFNPVLSEAKVYMRAAAFFSSSSFKAMGRGLSRLLSNGGSMKLLVSVVVSEEDYNTIIEGKKQREEAIASILTEMERQCLCMERVLPLEQMLNMNSAGTMQPMEPMT
jgi:uncharacterized circularly permuted ATP-grasp superfamily protein